MIPDLRFQNLEIHRGSYRVTYIPAWEGTLFAIIQLSYMEQPATEEIVRDMECEAQYWILRFSVSVIVSAFDVESNKISLESRKSYSSLTAVLESGLVKKYWQVLQKEQFPHGLYTNEVLAKLYSKLEYTSLAERENKARQQAKGIKIFQVALALCWLIPPLFMFFTGLAFPLWGIVVGLFTIYQAFYRASKLMGWVNYSKKDKEKSEKQLKMEHYFYHCELNQKGFERLKCENFKNQTIMKNSQKFKTAKGEC